MGINLDWQKDVLQAIKQEFNLNIALQQDGNFTIINCNNQLFIHLISIKNTFNPEDVLALQLKYQQDDLQLVQLWEDVWAAKRIQVLSRIRSFLGLNKSLHGRAAKIVVPSKQDTIKFLDQNHLQGYVNAKYSFALVNTYGEFLALASFSAVRPMKLKGSDYLSAELVRFVSANGFTVVGGFSKLIKHFLKLVKVNDIMTYADRDWSLGKGYEQLNFRLVSTTAPAFLYVDENSLVRYFPHRLPKIVLEEFKQQNLLILDDFLFIKGFQKVFNTGNLKYLLDL